MDSKLVQELKNAWRNVNAASSGFLQNIPSEKIAELPFDNRFKSFAWEFACIIRTRLCYLDELKTGIQNFEDREGIPNKDELTKESKAKMLEMLTQTSNKLIIQLDLVLASIKNDSLSFGERVRVRGTNEHVVSSNKLSRIIWLLQHERIHQGKLMLYLSQSGLKLPESFIKTWGETNFK